MSYVGCRIALNNWLGHRSLLGRFLLFFVFSALCAGATYTYWTLADVSLPLAAPDSTAYRKFNSAVTAGYPIFLLALRLLELPELVAVIIQLFLASLCAALLALVIWHAWARMLPGFLLIGLLWENKYFTELHAYILTDSSFSSLFGVALACVYGYTVTHRKIFLVAAAICAGGMTSIRPPGAAVVFGIALLLLLPSFGTTLRARLARALLFLLLAIVPIVTGEIVKWNYHDGNVSSMAGQTALARGIAVARRVPNSIDAEAASEIHRIRRDIAPFIEDAKELGVWSENWCLSNSINSIHQEMFRSSKLNGYIDSQSKIHGKTHASEMATLALPLLAGNIEDYARQSLVQWLGLWLIFAHPLDLSLHNDFMAHHRPLPQGIPDVIFPALNFKGMVTVAIVHLAYIWAFVSSIGLLLLTKNLFAECRDSGAPILNISVLAAWLLQASFMFIAFSNIAIPRYYLDYWPAIVFVSLVSLVVVGDYIRQGISMWCMNNGCQRGRE